MHPRLHFVKFFNCLQISHLSNLVGTNKCSFNLQFVYKFALRIETICPFSSTSRCQILRNVKQSIAGVALCWLMGAGDQSLELVSLFFFVADEVYAVEPQTGCRSFPDNHTAVSKMFYHILVYFPK